MNPYRLVKAEKHPNGVVSHAALMPWGEEQSFRYISVRIAVTWPTVENPAYIIVGGMEVEDELMPSRRGVIRVIEENEVQDLSSNVLFDALTSSYTANLCDSLYVDQGQEDYKTRLWQYLDERNLRGVNVMDLAYRDIVLRLSCIKDFNDSGDLVIEKTSPLFEDLKGLSRAHLKEKPESLYRVDALGYLAAGFSKYAPLKPLKMPSPTRFGSGGWMNA